MTDLSLPYRPNVCMLITNPNKLIFLGKRTGEANHWQFPQGGEEEGLTQIENVYKELEEELGADRDLFNIVKKLNHTHEYIWETPPNYAIGKWKGQSQTFWLVEFLGTDKDIQLNRHTPEFMSFRWVSIEEVYQLADKRRLKGYQGALEEISKQKTP